MLRHARYLPAVAFALLALAFVGLWVRSYHWTDRAIGPLGSHYVCVLGSTYGMVILDLTKFDTLPPNCRECQFEQHNVAPYQSQLIAFKAETALGLGFHFETEPIQRHIAAPHWFLALSSLAVAALLAFKPITRFTVRGLLITTTLLAAVLGLVVYAL